MILKSLGKCCWILVVEEVHEGRSLHGLLGCKPRQGALSMPFESIDRIKQCGIKSRSHADDGKRTLASRYKVQLRHRGGHCQRVRWRCTRYTTARARGYLHSGRYASWKRLLKGPPQAILLERGELLVRYLAH
jgi:hypothetical protein